MTRVLVLAGTTEATRLAHLLVDDGLEVISSFAGMTTDPLSRPGRVRTGGFGGVDGLRRYLGEEAIDLLIDATHPFAARMPHHAAAAAGSIGVPLVRILRPPWTPQPGDRWVTVATLPHAAVTVDELDARVVLLTVGRRELHHFTRARRARFVVRSIHPPDQLPPRTTVILDRGPFELPAERDLILRHGVDALVAKNAGGTATRAKLDAARELGLPVIMIERPAQPSVPHVQTVEAARRWVQAILSRG